MRAVIQAVSSASVRVEGGEPRAIGPGIMILLGVRDTDTLDIVPKLADKCAGLRIFPDAEGKLNLSARDLGYSALVVSQFTLYGDTKKGYRPSFIKAAKPPLSVDAYELFLAEISISGNLNFQPVRKRIYNRRSNTVKSTGYLVSSTTKFTSCMQHGKYNFYRRKSCFVVDTNRNSTSIIDNGHRIVFIDCYINRITEARQSFVYGIIDNLVYKMMQASG